MFTKIFFLTNLMFFFWVNCGFSQNYVLPKDYLAYKNYDDKEFRIEADLDKDGTKDLLLICAKKDSEWDNMVVLFLSSDYAKNKNYFSFPLSSLGYVLELKKDVLEIGACFGNGRFCKQFKFRYNAKLSNLQLIGYDEESFGNAAHDGAYNKSVNLLTNEYNLSKYKWNEKLEKDETFLKKTEKITFPVTTFKEMDEKKLESLEKIGSKYLE